MVSHRALGPMPASPQQFTPCCHSNTRCTNCPMHRQAGWLLPAESSTGPGIGRHRGLAVSVRPLAPYFVRPTCLLPSVCGRLFGRESAACTRPSLLSLACSPRSGLLQGRGAAVPSRGGPRPAALPLRLFRHVCRQHQHAPLHLHHVCADGGSSRHAGGAALPCDSRSSHW